MSKKYQSVSEKQAQQLVELLTILPKDRKLKDLKNISSCLENVKFLKNYQETAEYYDMLRLLQLEQWSLDHVLFKQGDEGDKFYIILTGVIGLFINIDSNKEQNNQNIILGQGIREVAKLYPGDAFGELSLLFNEQRTATAVCVEPTSLLVLNKEVFDKYLSNAKNEALDTMINYFKGLWIFKDLSHKDFLKLATKTTLSKCNSNTIIIRQGEKPKGIFFVHNGIVKIIQTMKFRIDKYTKEILDDFRDPDQSQVRQCLYKTVDMELEEFGNGGFFADYEVFNEEEVQYSAVTMTPTEILTVSKQDLKSVLKKELYEDLVKNATYYPSSQKIKKQFFENLMWKNFKSKVMLHYNHDLINQKRQHDNRVAFLNNIDLQKFKIYDEVQEEKKNNNELQNDIKISDYISKNKEESHLLKDNIIENQNPSNSKKISMQQISTQHRKQAEQNIKQDNKKLLNQNNKKNTKTIIPKIDKKSEAYILSKRLY